MHANTKPRCTHNNTTLTQLFFVWLERKNKLYLCMCMSVFGKNSLLSMPVHVCAAYMLLACSCEGVSGLSSQRSLMPQDSGRRLDGITGNWIVFHLLWKQPGRDTPPPPPPIPAVSTPRFNMHTPDTTPLFLSFSMVHPYSHFIMEACRTKPLLLHVIQSFPLRCRNAGLDVSRVLNKQLLAQYQPSRDPAQSSVSP